MLLTYEFESKHEVCLKFVVIKGFIPKATKIFIIRS